jgi:lysophospholipase L1-like esterase
MTYGQILCVGDSLTFGSRCEFSQCYPQMISKKLWEKYSQLWITAVEAIPGETTSDVVKKILRITTKYNDAKEMTLLLGTNDAKSNYPVEVFKANMRSIIGAGKVCGKRIYVMTLPPKLGFGSPGYENGINKIMPKYNEAIRELQKEIGFHLVECPALDALDFSDGIHFNQIGYDKLATSFVDKIVEVRG